MSIKGLIRKIAWKAVGMDDIRTQLDSLNYYFKSWHDISQFPKAQGPLIIAPGNVDVDVVVPRNKALVPDGSQQ